MDVCDEWIGSEMRIQNKLALRKGKEQEALNEVPARCIYLKLTNVTESHPMKMIIGSFFI